MNLIRHLTWQNMKHSRARTLVTILGILLSAAMFTAVTTMGVSFRSYMLEAEIAENGDYFIRYDYGTMEDLQNLQKNEAVTKLGTINTLGYTHFELQNDSRSFDDTLIVGAGNREFFEMLPIHLEAGRLPENGSELVITRAVYEYLEALGQPHEIGQQITLPIEGSYDSENMELPSSGVLYEKTYRIVGITEYVQYFGDNTLDLSHLLTFDDGSTDALWGRFFIKTKPQDAQAVFEQSYGLCGTINTILLGYYGVTEYASINTLIISFASILILIIMVGSVSLIYNSFSISVSERTKQFGLLSSVGATRKQIRQSVFTEALSLSIIGIPLGILCGYAGIAITLHLTHNLIDDILWSAAENDIILKAIPSVPAFVIAAVVALITVLISAWIPARRATKITPIAAIRQTREFQVPKGGIRAGKFTQKLFGLPAALSRKYYTVNKRKYRATVISLTISMVLFVSADCFVQQLNSTAEEQTNTDNFDFSIIVNSEEQVNQLRANPALKDSALVAHGWAQAAIPEEAFTDRYKTVWEAMATSYHYDAPISSKQIHIEYLEDSVLRDFLVEQGIDPAPYLDSDDPLALVTRAQLTTYQYDETGKPTDRQRFNEQILKDSVDTLLLVPSSIPDGVLDRLERVSDVQGIRVSDGVLTWPVMVPQELEDGTVQNQPYTLEIRPTEDGEHFAFYIRDPQTGEPETEPADVVPMEHASLRLGATIRDLPMGIRQNMDYDGITVILPLSAANQPEENLNLMATASDYEEFLSFLKSEAYVFADFLESQMQYRDYVTMIRIFSYGFITLISLICICNVFNTISTNIALRKKDFGMLRSVGMKNREINRMMAFECLQYGLKTMLWGIPLSLLSSLLIAKTVSMTAFTLPLQSLLSAAGGIFVTVFITMFYAVSKLKKQNPIEAICSES